MPTDQPPITDSPGDLRMIFKTVVEQMDKQEKTDQNDYGAVVGIALAARVSLDYWLELANGRSSLD